MRLKAITGIVLTVLLIGMLLPSVFMPPVSATHYEVKFTDVDGGSHKKGGWGIGRSDSDHDTTNGWIQVSAYIDGWGERWAEAEVYKEFTYEHEHDGYNWIKLRYYIYGAMIWALADCKFYVKVKIEDLSQGVELRTVTYDKENEYWFPKQYRTFKFQQVLVNGHEYRVTLKARAHCEVGIIPEPAGSCVDFLSDPIFDPYHIDWDHLKVYHRHVGTTTSDGEQTGPEVRCEYDIKQEKYDNADGLNFTSYNKHFDINGWNITITDFTNSSSVLDGTRDVDVQAWGTTIPKNATVWVEVTQWLKAEGDVCPNCLGLKDIRWRKAEEEEKAIPDHHWSLGYPVADPLRPGYYRHGFTMTNDDVQYNLTVSALQFLSTTTRYKYLSEISFTDPVYDFSLSTGESWTTDIITKGELIEGYIYFKYGIFNLTGEEIVCNAWGGHPVTPPPPPVFAVDVSVDSITDVDGTIVQVWGKPTSDMRLEGNPIGVSINVTATRLDTTPSGCFIIIGILRNETVIDSEIRFMGPGETVTVEFVWNERGLGPGDYLISARGGPIESSVNDTNLANNVVSDGYVHLKWLTGDINGDGKVNILDAIRLGKAFGSNLAAEIALEKWNPNCDFNSDDKVNILDAILLARNFGKTIHTI